MPETGVYYPINYRLEDNKGNVCEGSFTKQQICYNDYIRFIKKYDDGNYLFLVGYNNTNNYTSGPALEVSSLSGSDDDWSWTDYSPDPEALDDNNIVVVDNYIKRSETFTTDIKEMLTSSGIPASAFKEVDGTNDLNIVTTSYVSRYPYKILIKSPFPSGYENKFVKICVTEEVADGLVHMPSPCIYLYTGSAGSGDYDWLMDNPNADDYVFVSSDAPVYVHTLVIRQPYESCKDWSIQEWESYKENYGDKYMDFSDVDYNQRRYSIPMDKIDEGSCYCVIAHFADNHVEKSKVFQK